MHCSDKAKANPTFKDMDFTVSGERISVGPEEKERIMRSVEKDVQVLGATSLFFIILSIL